MDAHLFPYAPLAPALILTALGALAGWLTLGRLRTGFYRYDDDRPQRRLAWVVPAAGAVAGLTAYGLGDWAWPVPVTGALAAVAGVTLAAIDLDVHRLPRVLTWPCYPALALLLTLCSLVTDDWHALRRAALVGFALWAGYYLLHRLAPRGGLGRGDVTLAGLLGMALGWFGWEAAAVGTYLAFLMAGLAAGALLLTRRITRSDRIAFGPAMIAGALLVLAAQ